MSDQIEQRMIVYTVMQNSDLNEGKGRMEAKLCDENREKMAHKASEYDAPGLKAELWNIACYLIDDFWYYPKDVPQIVIKYVEKYHKETMRGQAIERAKKSGVSDVDIERIANRWP